MTRIQKQLQRARPSLRVVSPLAWWVVMIMAGFNIILGLSFIFALDTDKFTAPLLIVNDHLSFDFWGVVFIIIGIVKAFSLKTNNWNLSRKSLLFGVSVKGAWAVALTVRTFISPGTAFLNLCWITLALLQMGAYIWFMPPSIQTNTKEDE